MRTTAWGCTAALGVLLGGCGGTVVEGGTTSMGAGGATGTGTVGTTTMVPTTTHPTGPFACPPNTEDLATWQVAGSTPEKYHLGLDPAVSCNGEPSLSLSSTVASGSGDFGTLTRMISAAPYAGKRLRFRGSLHTVDVTGWAGLWMRVDGKNQFVYAFDGMANRPVVGTTDWTSYDVVLDVSPFAIDVAYGVLLVNEGAAWLDGVSLDVVDSSVPTTG